MKKLQPNDIILAFGDSLTFGQGVSLEESYPSVLAKLTGFEVINAGISGETTTQGAKRFASVLDKHNPQLVVLLEGGNDFLMTYSEKSVKQNLSQMIKMAKDKGIDVVLVGVPQKSIFLTKSPLYEELATEYNLALDNDIIRDLLGEPSLKSDTIHFNALGYEKLAQSIYDMLKKYGAI